MSKHNELLFLEDDVCFDDIHDNYYHNLTKKQKEWLDEGDTGLTVCDKCGLVQSWEGEVFCKGDDWQENINCDPYEVLCHACFDENRRTCRARLTIAYYKTIKARI